MGRPVRPPFFLSFDIHTNCRGCGGPNACRIDFVATLYSKEKQKGRPHGPPHLKSHENSCERQRYFFSSEGFSVGVGAGVCAGGAGVCELPDMPSLKLRMPSPNPFMTSGMRRPPKKISTTARTISQ